MRVCQRQRRHLWETLKRVIVSPAVYPRFLEITELARSLCHSWASCLFTLPKLSKNPYFSTEVSQFKPVWTGSNQGRRKQFESGGAQNAGAKRVLIFFVCPSTFPWCLPIWEGTTKIVWALKHPILRKLDEIMHYDPRNQIIGWALAHPAHL